jgi:hypothetical protein
MTYYLHRNPRCPGRLRPARSWSRCEVQSLAQALKDRPDKYRVSSALHADHGPARKLDVDGAGCRRPLLRDSLSYLGFTRNRHADRKQSRRWTNRLRKLATPEGTSPCKYLVGVYPMCPCHQSHTRTRLQRQLDNPPLLCNRTKSASTPIPTLCLNHEYIVRLKPAGMPDGKTTRLP